MGARFVVMSLVACALAGLGCGEYAETGADWADALSDVPFAVPVDAARLSRAAPMPPAAAPAAVAPWGQANQGTARVAYSAARNVFLVVWWETGSGGNSVLGARVTIDGRVIDTVPIQICSRNSSQSLPDVASDGIDFVVVWGDTDNWVSNIFTNKVDGLTGAVASANGTRVGPPGQSRPVASPNVGFPRLAWNGQTYLVVWMEGSGRFLAPSSVSGALLDPSGNPTSPVFQVTSKQPARQQFPAVAGRQTGNGGEFLVTWTNFSTGQPEIVGQIIDSQGRLTTQLLPLSGGVDSYWATTASDGRGFLAAWFTSRGEIRGTVVSPAGTIASPGGARITRGVQPDLEFNPATGGYTLAFGDAAPGSGLDAFGALLDWNGALVPPLFPISRTSLEEAESAVAVAGGGRALPVFTLSDSQRSWSDLCGVLLKGDRVLRSLFAIRK